MQRSTHKHLTDYRNSEKCSKNNKGKSYAENHVAHKLTPFTLDFKRYPQTAFKPHCNID